MITPDLLKYIAAEVKSGKPKDQIRFGLIQGGGWHINDLDEAFARLDHPEAFAFERKHASPTTIAAIIIVIAVGGYFVMRRYNIHSVQDFQTFFASIITKIRTLL